MESKTIITPKGFSEKFVIVGSDEFVKFYIRLRSPGSYREVVRRGIASLDKERNL